MINAKVQLVVPLEIHAKPSIRARSSALTLFSEANLQNRYES
jgi:hypothetical protein